MRLTRVSIPVLDPTRAAGFYRDVLGLSTVLSAEAATVEVGSSTLELRAAEDPVGSHHLAFTIPTGTFGRAKAWLTARIPLLGRDGIDEFEGPPSWNSRSLYFPGPENAVLELIERRDLDHGSGSGAFRGADVVSISEIGVAVADVVQTAVGLRVGDLVGYGGGPGPGFAAIGDVHGLLVLVPPGRAWMPTTDRLVAAVPTLVEATHAVAARYELGSGGSLILS